MFKLSFLLIITAGFLYTAPLYYPQFYFLSWFSLLPLLYYLFKLKKDRLSYKKFFITGWLFGIIVLIFSANFLYYAVKLYTDANFLIIIFLLILLFSLLALSYGLFFLIYIYLQDFIFENKLFSPFFFAFMWTLFEFFRHHILFFFPLANPAYTQAEFLSFIQLADPFGIWFLTFVLILINSLFFKFTLKRKYGNLAIILIIFLFIFTYGQTKISYYDKLSAASEAEIRVGIITTNIAQKDKWSAAQLDKNIKILINSAEFLNQSELIIAPETNITFDLNSNLTYQKRLLKKISKNFNTPILLGSLASKKGSSGKFNSSFLINPGGEIIKRYNKNLLLYFGENYPSFLENILNNFSKYNFSSLNRGQNSGYFKYKDLSWKIVICSEILTPEYTKLDSDSLDFIVNQTNEAWFNNSKILKNTMWQAAVIRAVENRTPVIKTGNQSFNGIIYASGKYFKSDYKAKYQILKFN